MKPIKNLELGIKNEERTLSGVEVGSGNLEVGIGEEKKNTPQSPLTRGEEGQTTDNRTKRIREYFQTEALSSTKLADFYIAPDIVLMEREEKPYFDEGRAFEMMVEDRAKGTSLFKDNFFVAEIEGALPKELPQWIADGTLDEQYVYTKSGDLSKTYATRHAWLDVCLANPNKKPLSVITYNQLKIMVDHLWKAEAKVLDHVTKNYITIKAGRLLENGSFQVPYFWKADGHKKKALYDVISFVEFGGSLQAIHIDLKKTANLSQFKSMFRTKYWVQDRHYSEGISKLAEDKNIYTEPYMLFFVSSMEKPYLAQIFRMDDESAEYADDVYTSLCHEFTEWKQKGMKPKGWIEQKNLKVFL